MAAANSSRVGSHPSRSGPGAMSTTPNATITASGFDAVTWDRWFLP